jgi:hypothetical protein
MDGQHEWDLVCTDVLDDPKTTWEIFQQAGLAEPIPLRQLAETDYYLQRAFVSET